MDYFATLAATWPARIERRDGWILRRARGAGSRVSSATREEAGGDPRIAEAAMREMGQRPLFMIRSGDEDLDSDLATMGYEISDESALLSAPATNVAAQGPDRAVILCDAPLARMREIWDEGGIGPARLDVMDRASGPKTYLLARDGDRPCGCAFVAAADGVAMIHALCVAPFARRKGLGERATKVAAAWALRNGAQELALAVRRKNGPALTLYERLGFTHKERYHYRRAAG